MDETSEEWRPAPLGYGDNYQVSSLGRVWSRPRRRTAGGILAQRINHRGYASVILAKEGKQVRYDVHRLVALTFIGPRPEGQEVRHLNGDRTDPRLINLAYGSRSDNVQDSLAHGTNPNARKTHCNNGHPFDEINTYVIASRPNARYCRPCSRARSRAHYVAHRAVKNPRT